MKLSRILSLLLVLSMLLSALASCELFNSNSTDTTTTTGNSATPDPDEWDELYDIITVAKALEIAEGASTATDAIYYVRGTIVTISNRDYGEMTISDGTGEILVYNTKGADKSTYFPNLAETPVKGDEVLLLCSLLNFNGTLEIKQAYLIDFHEGDREDIDISAYTEMTVAEAREAAEGTNIKLTGTVAAITYANGKIPNGVYIVDGTDSIYVYDGDIASQVKVGNTVTVLGSKDYWILEKEQSSAEKFNYKGCCQLSSATLVEKNTSITDINFSWCEEKTVKEICDTPVTENVTTTIYKTCALVKKVPGDGFVNYYLFDLDENTGSYVYTHCNGSDFGWLDEFDGKICTVYLSPINAKAESSDCFFRFLPIKVIDENYTFDKSKTTKFAVIYHGITQFQTEYSGNPNKELATEVSSTLLGFEGAKLSYSSNNESVINFVEKDGKIYLVCNSIGKATVTVSASYENYDVYSAIIEITVVENVNDGYVTVKEAVDTAVTETVTVKGIVAGTIANKDSGFYLIDETGVIAVLLTSTDELKKINIGEEVIVTGTRDRFHNGATTHAGQTCITNATVTTNYGDHKYSTASFVTGMTIGELYDLDPTVDYSTTVFVVEGTIKKSGSNYSTNYAITADGESFNLYSGSGAQYAWLDQFIGQTVTIEVAACNWNNKTYWRGCIISIITADGQVFNTYNFDKLQ